MPIMLYLLPFWRQQLQWLHSKALGTVKHLLVALLPFVFQSLAVVCLSNAKSALLLILYERQKIIVQGKHPYLLEHIMKRTAVSAALVI